MKFQIISIILLVFLAVWPIRLVAEKPCENLADCALEMDSESAQISRFDLLMLKYNIERAYDVETGLIKNQIHFDRNQKMFRTRYYVPPDSFINNLEAKLQYEYFEAAINGLRLGLIDEIFGGKYTSDEWREIGEMLEVNFLTVEDKIFYIIGKFENGELRLIRQELEVNLHLKF
ncbi:MAG: hypothetical protein JKP90_17490 [Desulfofustis sp. PB-SRB1]|nr:hypothetical protein [Desulfofustis sp. PB-SRB1]